MDNQKQHPSQGSLRSPLLVPPGGLDRPAPNADPTNPSQPPDPTRQASGYEDPVPSAVTENEKGTGG
jgi:hypothetical protein